MEFSLSADTTPTDYRRTIKRRRGPLGSERFDVNTRGSIKMVRDKYKAQPRTAHKIKQMVSRIYSWADEADLVDEGFNPAARLKKPKEIGRASCRERVSQDVKSEVVAVSIKKKKHEQLTFKDISRKKCRTRLTTNQKRN